LKEFTKVVTHGELFQFFSNENKIKMVGNISSNLLLLFFFKLIFSGKKKKKEKRDYPRHAYKSQATTLT
jgi:hypothetical protein